MLTGRKHGQKFRVARTDLLARGQDAPDAPAAPDMETGRSAQASSLPLPVLHLVEISPVQESWEEVQKVCQQPGLVLHLIFDPFCGRTCSREEARLQTSSSVQMLLSLAGQ
jgi:hypothetical protein